MRIPCYIVCSATLLVALGDAAIPSVTVSRPLQASSEPANVAGAQMQDGERDRLSAHIYRTALRYYQAGSYWKAARELAAILDAHPSYREIDGVLVYLGESLLHMRMYDTAGRMFRYVSSKHPTSEHLLQAWHGLQRVYYETGKVEESLKIYGDLAKRSAGDDIVDGIHYYGGLAYYQRHDHDNAVAALGKIRPRSEYSAYGLYSTGLALLKGKSITKAVDALRKVLKQPLIQPEQQQLLSATHLTLGYIYYELGYYREAIAHLGRIGKDHEEYAPALLASCWAAFKLKEYQAAVVTLNELIEKFEQTEYGEEAHFLLGQCYVELGFLDFATQQYDVIIQHYPASGGVSERIAVTEAGLREQERTVEQIKLELLLLESALADLILLESAGKMPPYIEKERQRWQAARDRVFETILAERDSVESLSESISAMRRHMEQMQSRRHWQAYAEYGKIRLYFLKGLTSSKR